MRTCKTRKQSFLQIPNFIKKDAKHTSSKPDHVKRHKTTMENKLNVYI